MLHGRMIDWGLMRGGRQYGFAAAAPGTRQSIAIPIEAKNGSSSASIAWLVLRVSRGRGGGGGGRDRVQGSVLVRLS